MLPIGRSSEGVTLSFVTDQQTMDEALAVRLRVFVEEQRVPLEEEVDRYDESPGANPAAVHVIARLEGRAIATARLLLDGHDRFPHIGRVAVLAEHRGTGVGRLVMECLQDEARRRGYSGITLSAQTQAIPFYERLGYVARGPIYLDAGIEHRDMDLEWGELG